MPIKPKTKRRPWEPEKSRTPFARRNNGNSSFYNSSVWKRARKAYLFEHPFCECNECKRLPVPLTAEVVDHITPINQGGEPLAPDNFQSMNGRCHNKKSGKEAHV